MSKETMDADDNSEAQEPTAEEIAEMRKATPADAAAVDALILSECLDRWRKVAMVMGVLMDRFESRFPHLPFVYMQIRMLELEDSGKIEIAGDVMSMRASEVRLSRSVLPT